jgi:hypothetical protein
LVPQEQDQTEVKKIGAKDTKLKCICVGCWMDCHWASDFHLKDSNFMSGTAHTTHYHIPEDQNPWK